MLNLTVICHRCDVNLTVVNLRYEQFWGFVILLMRIDKWSLEYQRYLILTNLKTCYSNRVETSKVFTRWGVLKFFIVRGSILTWQNPVHFIKEMNTGIFFVILPFYGRELVRDFGRESGIKTTRIFSKPSAINGFGVPLPTTVWVGLAM